MRRLPVFFLILLVFSCRNKALDREQIIFDRIAFIFNLKQEVDQEVWKSFNEKIYDVPLIYFTDTSSYIANPTQKFLTAVPSKLVFDNGQIRIYKSEQRVDQIPFHMETGLTLGDPTGEYNYHSPFMKCSSYEETSRTIPDVLSTEEWVTMIMHEYFHGFQYKHQNYIDFYEKNIVQIQPDSLKSIYKNHDWFRNSIDQENIFLLKAIDETDNTKRDSLIDAFFKLRNERRKNTEKKLRFKIEQYEKCYETMEGTARYVEYGLYNLFAVKQPDNSLESDTSFKSYKKYKNFRIENDKWLYLPSKTTYFYAIGFNMARLLDRLKINYKSKLFNKGELSLEEILQTKNGR